MLWPYAPQADSPLPISPVESSQYCSSSGSASAGSVIPNALVGPGSGVGVTSTTRSTGVPSTMTVSLTTWVTSFSTTTVAGWQAASTLPAAAAPAPIRKRRRDSVSVTDSSSFGQDTNTSHPRYTYACAPVVTG